MSWKDALQAGEEIVLATCSKKCVPRAIVVVSLGFADGKLLIGAAPMKTSFENVRENNLVSIVAKRDGEYYRMGGRASVHSSGKYLDLAIERSKPPLPTRAITVDVGEVFDLDKGKKIL